ncbi:PstS family phosphate ABC transporter substrate-binding protein [Kordiimonas laminariae]|uniref:PstS family phosphate ABC transporter substrate-binding protein n=1 Tax=Kordiimonas laminariae TaxID=2917717 RepID=UPI001FF22A17|nr:PstS family phosphate ABC transporter substrate-binding protein [Kordiimonas laminariae]MCK0070430.1 PstS family phosphate ABC transporter substrate-binding protein [Kordiimonas laminariae]
MMTNLKLMAVALISTVILSSEALAQSRNQIRVVGSSTVFPFSTAVAEEFGRTSSYKTPIVEATGTGGGFKLFCNGIGTKYPDITNASRAIKPSERSLCAARGVTEVAELKIGYDGIVLAQKKQTPALSITVRELYLALASRIPAAGSDGRIEDLIENPYVLWSDINPALPKRKISVMGPPPTSGTRDAFNELAIQSGCKTFPEMAALETTNPHLFHAHCQSIREDGVYIEAGENDNLIVQKLLTDSDTIGIFGYSFLDQNADMVDAVSIATNNGQYLEPTFESISTGEYPISRSLYIYIKKAHIGIIPGIKDFIEEFTSDRAAGELGYLAERGLVPLLDEERDAASAQAKNLVSLELQP